MRVAFRAREGGFIADEDAIGFSLAGNDDEGGEHYLNLHRSPEGTDPEEDWGIHLEFDSQGNSGYGCLSLCRLSRQLLAVELSKPLGQWHPEVEGFDVTLDEISDETYQELRSNLPRAFRGFEGQLVLA